MIENPIEESRGRYLGRHGTPAMLSTTNRVRGIGDQLSTGGQFYTDSH